MLAIDYTLVHLEHCSDSSKKIMNHHCLSGYDVLGNGLDAARVACSFHNPDTKLQSPFIANAFLPENTKSRASGFAVVACSQDLVAAK